MRPRSSALRRQEVVAVPHRLDEHEGAVEHQRHHAGEDELRRAERRPGRGHRVVRQDERERGQRGQDGERGARALGPGSPARGAARRPRAGTSPTMPLQTIMTAANTVSRASPALSGAAPEHHRDDQRHLDHRHGDGEHQRAERLADPVGHHLGVVDGREHGRDQDHRGDPGQHAARGRHGLGRQHRPGQGRPRPGPPGRPSRQARHAWVLPASSAVARPAIPALARSCPVLVRPRLDRGIQGGRSSLSERDHPGPRGRAAG